MEVKLRWTTDAWWQLRELYIPVLTAALPRHQFCPVVICRSYDPSFHIPEEVNLIDSVGEADVGKFNVMIWKP